MGSAPRLAVFLTDLGWFGLLGSGRAILALSIGHTAGEHVRTSIAARMRRLAFPPGTEVSEADWSPALRQRLEDYARGVRVDFRDCRVALPQRTDFQRRVLQAVSRVGYGETVRYGELADWVGSPRAARAVGSVMASNTLPIIVPCHRVVAAGGRLGGFSAPQGVGLKERLLAMEAEAAG